MSTIGWIIVAIVVVVVIVAALAVWWGSRRQRRRSAQADALRAQAEEHTPRIGTERKHAREAAVRADEARAEAEQAQREADAARRGLAQEEAAQEDKLREADRLDPRVDDSRHAAEPSEDVADTTPQGSTGGAHRR